ncbi:hypothetical protein M5K25_006866 [Dendrobium thyrsiflorum]|uniref:RNase H type-1 domain-containing protein n=1 Tax=Dendrobium thyrsiflorum TaxID=117978 RepID=A0ABD0VCQ2_DENTH
MHYLGVKMALRRPVKSDFRIILDHALAKLNAWGSRCLSMAGRALLIKSSLLSLSIFLSTLSLVPKNKERKGLHYISWEELCKPKSLGGFGLHSSVTKAGPIRSRITWRFIQNPNSLCNRTIISKYGINVWNGMLRRGNSPTWIILVEGAKSLKSIIRWKLSNGTKVSIMDDTWIFDKPLSKWPTFVNYNELQNEYVNKFLAEDDKIELIKQHSGKSITALSYDAWLEAHKSVSEAPITETLNCFKKFKLLPKVELFWWRLCKNGLRTNSFLNYKGLIQSNLCPCGCNELKNQEHVAVFSLQLFKIIKRLRDWGFHVPTFESFSNCLVELKRLSIDNLNIVKLYYTTVYYSWKRRNQINLGVDTSSVNFLDSSYVDTWRPPPIDWIKINVDATLQESYNAGRGAIIRDHKGRFICAFGKHLKHWDVVSLELHAILLIREHLQRWLFQQKGVIIEGDNHNVIKWLHESLKKIKGQQLEEENKEILFLNEFNNVTQAKKAINLGPRKIIIEILYGTLFRPSGFRWKPLVSLSEPIRSSLSSTCLRVEGKRGRAWEREEEICEGEFVRVFTKVAPSKGSVRLLRASSRIFEDLGGVHFSEKKRFSAGFWWKQKELRFSAGFRRKRKESKVLCLTGLVKRASADSSGQASVSNRPGRYLIVLDDWTTFFDRSAGQFNAPIILDDPAIVLDDLGRFYKLRPFLQNFSQLLFLASFLTL